jgi:hypothetical protein
MHWGFEGNKEALILKARYLSEDIRGQASAYMRWLVRALAWARVLAWLAA